MALGDIGKLGRDEGREAGPPPGEGATIHAFGGGPDMEGTPPHELPPAPNRGAPAGAAATPARSWLVALAFLLVLGIVLWLLALALPW